MTVQAVRTTFTILMDEHEIIPITDRPTIYVEGLDAALAAGYGNLVDSPERAQVALVRLRPGAGCTGQALEQAGEVAITTSTIVDVDRGTGLVPALGSALGCAQALLVSADESDEAFLDLVFGRDR
ncbi:hypothetical protein KIH74_32670 [Kineosporia sp. J2-2]|uniref:Uncharacterized protein n=1 Tax=Kineosporia corallincola TaxID=2835133 RepID=A0ABS5TSH0_9ACTN|nr:hypothetical protein [Kineosporia corallincola]MBT0773745.1 hypothetical protein [Kineosporia corallincola]